MNMWTKHIDTHRNPGADAENIIAHFSIDFKQCRLKDEIFGKAFGILNPFFQKGALSMTVQPRGGIVSIERYYLSGWG